MESSTIPTQHAPELLPKRQRWLLPFTRITTSGDYLPEIDGLRFIAIFAVLLHHLSLLSQSTARQSGGIFDLGQKGVELFFVISGFILAVPFARQYLLGEKKVGLRSYLVRRLTRLEPPYVISLLLLFVLKLISRGNDPEQLFKSLIASTLYLHNYVYGTVSIISGVAWSLEVEVQFYLLMPLLAMMFLVRNAIVRRAILLAAMVGIVFLQPICIGTPTGRPSIERHLGNYIQFFLAGIFLADVFVTNWKSQPSKTIWGDVVWWIGWPVLILMLWREGIPAPGVYPHSPGAVLLAPMILLLYVAMFRSTLTRKLVSIPLIATIGGMCYSIYLIHNTLMLLGGEVFRSILVGRSFGMTMVLVFLLITPIVLIFSAIYFTLIERPCMRRDWPKRLLDRLYVEEKS